MPQPTAPATPLRVLIVEDQILDAELMLAELERAGFALTNATRVETAAEFVTQLAASPDVILCDYALPAFSAPEALRILQQRNLDLPFIIISGSIGEETAVEAVKAGADDYLLKDRLGRIGTAVSQALEEKKLRTAARQAEEDLRQSEHKYRVLFEHLPDAAYLCDSATGRIIDVNRRGETLLGLDRAGVLGMRLSRFVPAATFRALIGVGQDETGRPGEFETDIEFNGRRAPVRIHASIIRIYNRRLLLAFFREQSSTT